VGFPDNLAGIAASRRLAGPRTAFARGRTGMRVELDVDGLMKISPWRFAAERASENGEEASR
jgi:hypothetical protein